MELVGGIYFKRAFRATRHCRYDNIKYDVEYDAELQKRINDLTEKTGYPDMFPSYVVLWHDLVTYSHVMLWSSAP